MPEPTIIKARQPPPDTSRANMDVGPLLLASQRSCEMAESYNCAWGLMPTYWPSLHDSEARHAVESSPAIIVRALRSIGISESAVKVSRASAPGRCGEGRAGG